LVRLWVANTDPDWFDFLASQPDVDEVNFWQPSGNANFGAVSPGELFLFRLKSPRNAIGGYGVFSHASNLPISLAWEAFGTKNGASESAGPGCLAMAQRTQISRLNDNDRQNVP
jgi:putative restriction endonuclease